MKPIRTKLLVKHSADCYAVKNTLAGTWKSPWAYQIRTTYVRSKKHLVFRCNCTECPAEVRVNEMDLIDSFHSDKLNAKRGRR